MWSKSNWITKNQTVNIVERIDLCKCSKFQLQMVTNWSGNGHWKDGKIKSRFETAAILFPFYSFEAKTREDRSFYFTLYSPIFSMTISWATSDHLELKFCRPTQVDTLYNMHCLIFSNSISIDRSDIWNRALLLSFLSSVRLTAEMQGVGTGILDVRLL